MNVQKLKDAIFSRHAAVSVGPNASGLTTLRRDAARRSNRTRRPSLEGLEERLVLSTSPDYTWITDLVTINGSTTNHLTPSGGDPPGVQAGGTMACVTITVPADYTGALPIRIGLADYTTATYPGGDTQTWLNNQVYFSSSSAVFAQAGESRQICVNLAECTPGGPMFQQLDVFAYSSTSNAPDNFGGLVTNFSTSDYYGYFQPEPHRLLGGAVVSCIPTPNMPDSRGNPAAFSQGYYKNHPNALPANMAIGNQIYTRDELVTLLKTNPSGGNATLIAVHQLITSFANLENGVPLTTNISNAIRQCEAILDDLPTRLILGGVYNTATAIKSSTANGTILTNAGGVLETINP